MVVLWGVGDVRRDNRRIIVRSGWRLAVAWVPIMVCGGVGAARNVLVSVGEMKGVWV